MLLFGACPGPGGGDASRDGAQTDVVLEGGFANCVDDEALDLDYDKAMGIDCNEVRAAIDARRTPRERESVSQMARVTHDNVRRCCVSREQLVLFMRTPQGIDQGFTAEEQRAADRVAGSLLCDRLTRELKTRLYLARNPQCLLGEPPADGGGPSDIFDSGATGGGAP